MGRINCDSGVSVAAVVHLDDGMMRMLRSRLGWFSSSLPRLLQHLGVPAVGEGTQPQGWGHGLCPAGTGASGKVDFIQTGGLPAQHRWSPRTIGLPRMKPLPPAPLLPCPPEDGPQRCVRAAPSRGAGLTCERQAPQAGQPLRAPPPGRRGRPPAGGLMAPVSLLPAASHLQGLMWGAGPHGWAGVSPDCHLVP